MRPSILLLAALVVATPPVPSALAHTSSVASTDTGPFEPPVVFPSADLEAIVTEIGDGIHGELDAQGEAPGSATAELDAYEVYLGHGFPTMALGALGRAKAAAAFTAYETKRNETAPEGRKALDGRTTDAQALRATVALQSSVLLPDSGVGDRIPWDVFERRLLAATYVAQSQWHANHSGMLAAAAPNGETTNVRVAIRNAEANALNQRFVLALVLAPPNPGEGRFVERSELLRLAEERFEKTIPGHSDGGLVYGGPFSEAFRWRFRKAIDDGLPVLALGMSLAWAENQGGMSAQHRNKWGQFSRPLAGLDGATGAYEDVRQSHPDFEGLVVVDRIQQGSLVADGTQTGGTNNQLAHAQVAFLVEAFTIYSALGMVPEAHVNISGFLVAVGIGVLGLALIGIGLVRRVRTRA